MAVDETTREAARVMSVCNACRYCEQYCPVFQAMEQRLEFARADVNYLANLCHSCGECLYACQYAPPHEFSINVPRTFARQRVQSYEQYAWPAALGAAFRRQGVATALAVAALLIAAFIGSLWLWNPDALRDAGAAADFYAVMPHGVMVALFGGIGVFVVVALTIGVRRCWDDFRAATPPDAATPVAGGTTSALGDVLTLRHLHVAGRDCVTREETRNPWRRRLHHAVFYGFLLCFASTSVAALYHASGSPAPYSYTSLPVLLGTLGGIGLSIGAGGLLLQRRRHDPALTSPAQEGLDGAFLVLLLLTAVSGLGLLALRHSGAMGWLLGVHLGSVLALFVSLPYGKFVHGLYRAAALCVYRRFAAASRSPDY